MSDYFLGEIRLFAIGYAPSGWALCNGATLPVQQNTALYSLLGTTYGGNTTAFQLPDLRGRAMLASGVAGGVLYKQGQASGSETVTLTTNTMPAHNHEVAAATANGTLVSPSGNVIATCMSGTTQVNAFVLPGNGSMVALAAATIGPAGGGTAHQNMQPYAVINPCISIVGLYPSRP